MSCIGASILTIAMILAAILGDFIFASRIFFYNEELFEPDIVPANRTSAPSMARYGHQAFINAYDGADYNIGVTTSANFAYTSHEPTASHYHYYYSDQPNVIMSPYANLYGLTECPDADYNPKDNLELVIIDQRPTIVHTSAQPLNDLNLDNHVMPNNYDTTLNVPNVPLGITRISELGPDLVMTAKRLRFLAPGRRGLSRQPIPTGGPDSESRFKGIIYSPFCKEGSGRPPIWGRTGESEVYIRATESTIFLFKTKPGSDPPMAFKSRLGPEFRRFKRVFEDTEWCVQISASGKLSKIGDDPSKVMTLWTVINGKVDKVGLEDQEISGELSLQEGNLFVAIPTQLNFIMQEAGKGKTYENLLDSIESYTDFDILVFIAKVSAGIPARTTPTNAPKNLTNVSYLGQQVERSIAHFSSQPPNDLNPGNTPLPEPLFIALETPDVLQPLRTISEFDSGLREKMLADGFLVPGVKLFRRVLSKKETDFSNGVVCLPFVKGPSSAFRGRTGRSELHIYVRQSIVSLCEMKPGSNAPEIPNYRTRPTIDELGKIFEAAKWSIHTEASGSLAKIGADHSKIMTLWAITGGRIKKIDLKGRFKRESCLAKKGGLIVAIPTQLNHMMRSGMVGRTYESFVSFIEPYVDLGLDALIFVVKV